MSTSEVFTNDAQNAIFNFFFVLVDDYSLSMSRPEALDKACDWLISLGTNMKAQAQALREASKQKEKLFKETHTQD
jgi:hypothetical protein